MGNPGSGGLPPLPTIPTSTFGLAIFGLATFGLAAFGLTNVALGRVQQTYEYIEVVIE